MKILYLKAFRRKKYFLFLILLFSLFLISSFFKKHRVFKNKKSTKDNSSYRIYIPETQTMDPIAAFKSRLYKFEHIKNPCWYEPPFIVPNIIKEMQMLWHGQVFSKEIPTPNMKEVLTDIRTKWFLHRQTKFKCFPYFYIMSSNNCIRNEIVNLLIQHPQIKAPSKIDIDFWPNVRSDNIDSYADNFEIPSNFLAEDKFIITFDASSSTFFQNNQLFNSKGQQKYSTADFIHAFNKNVKIFVFLQNPVTKLYADYLTNENTSNPQQFHDEVIESITMFKKCLQVCKLVECIHQKNFTQTYPVSLHLGIYWVFLERWYHKFSTQQMKLYSIEDALNCKKCLMDNIHSFLSISDFSSKESNPNIFYNCLNPEIPMLKETKIILNAFYSPYNKKLAQITGNTNFLWQ